MSIWYAILNALGLPMFEMDFMKNALLAVLLMAPLFGLLSTMIVTGPDCLHSHGPSHGGARGLRGADLRPQRHGLQAGVGPGKQGRGH